MIIEKHQRGIVQDIPPISFYLFFKLKEKSSFVEPLQYLSRFVDGESIVLGLGEAIMAKTSLHDLYHPYSPTQHQKKIASKPSVDLGLWLRGNDQGVLMHSARQLIQVIKKAFECVEIIRSFAYLPKRKEDRFIVHDLSGFEDGTENPKNEAKLATGIITSENKYINGGSCWVAQKWCHDFAWLDKASQQAKEALIGRSLDDNREFKNNQNFAHVKRTEQESFIPEAFMLRRSMPWINDKLQGGLMFSCFAQNFRPFEVQFNRMTGGEDGVMDGLFTFSTIQSTQFFWCPPFAKGRLVFPKFL